MTSQNKAIFSLVLQVHLADNQINIEELQYMKDVASVLQLTTEDINEISANPKDYILDPPPPEQERMRILYWLLFAMRIDGDINPKEEAILYRVGMQLGFSEMMLTEFVDELKKHLTTRLPDDALVKIIKKYLN